MKGLQDTKCPQVVHRRDSSEESGSREQEHMTEILAVVG